MTLTIVATLRRLVSHPTNAVIVLGCLTFVACLAVAALLGEATPWAFDEFGYLLSANTLATGHAATPTPPHPEFFESPPVLLHPDYVSKFFPAQGLFLAVGELITGHPIVGVWLSAALACAATCWMLQGWIGPGWGLVGGCLMCVQLGVFSYWSQSYWGGMVSALGGALFFGSVRRLWDTTSPKLAVWLGIGLLLLATSRPLEGLVVALPTSVLLLVRLLSTQAQSRRQILLGLAVIVLGLAGTIAAFDYSTTGAVWPPPYLLHERQYQETPLFVFLPPRPRLFYSSYWLEYYYRVLEARIYVAQRTPIGWLIIAGSKAIEWWWFYIGPLLTVPLICVSTVRRSRLLGTQVTILAIAVTTAVLYHGSGTAILAINLLFACQFVLLWIALDSLWHRLALGTCLATLVLMLLTKWGLPHYFAPATCLVFFLETEACRILWYCRLPSDTNALSTVSTAVARRMRGVRIVARGGVVAVLAGCIVALGINIGGRRFGWRTCERAFARKVLSKEGIAYRRTVLCRWLERQPLPQLVFVRYSAQHNVNDEWVYNHANISNSHVVWARDLGREHNLLLLQAMAGRVTWLVEPDAPVMRLERYMADGLAIPLNMEANLSAATDYRGDRLPW